MPCRIARAREWSVRMLHEMSCHEASVFVTLTYNDENLPPDGSLQKRDLQLFWKRLRKALRGRKIRYYACGEYGEDTGRPHYHAICFGDLGNSISGDCEYNKAWGKGFVKVGSVTYDSCRYVAQYIDKKYNGDKAKEVYGDRQPPFQVCSQGIGKQWALENAEYLKQNLGCTVKGKKVGLPRYYRKLLDISKDDLMELSLEAERKEKEIYAEKGFVTESEYLHREKESREQNLENIKARLSIKKRNKI